MKKTNQRKAGIVLSLILFASIFLSVLVIPLPIAKASPSYSWSTFTVAESGDDVETLAYTGWSNYTMDGENLWVHSNEYTTTAWLRFEGLSSITESGGVIDQIILSMYSGADEGADYEEVPGGYVTVAAPMTQWNWELTEENLGKYQMNPIASFDGDYLSPSGSWFNWTISTGDPRDWYAWSSDFNDVFICYVGGFMQYSPDWTYYRSFTSFDEGHPAKIYVKYHGDHQGYQEVLDYFDVDAATYVQDWNNYNFWSISGSTLGFGDWLYRKKIDVNGTALGNQTDYQIELEWDMFSALPTNNATFQTTPTSDATGQVVHPSILYFPDSWNGYKYWMAMTPYPDGNDDVETPEILACDDGESWEVPSGLTNPIVARDAVNPNTDPCLFYNEATDELWVYWRKMSGTYNRLYLKKSSDGVDWSGTGPGTLLLDLGTSSLSSPSVTKVNETYHLWYVKTADAPNGIKHRTSADGESWGSEEACNLYGDMPSGKEPWHLGVRYMTDFSEYWILLTVCNTGTGGTASILAFARSRDGVDLYMYPDVLLYLGAGGNWDNTIVYKATAILDDSTLKIWYSACNAALVWHVGYTTATIDATITDMMSKMRLDNGDLRFTEDDGVTELDYWLEESFGGKIKAWVKVSTIPVEGTTIYVYYGKDDATTTSSIKDASWNNIGDDFNDNSRDTGIWDIVEEEAGSPSETNERLESVNPTGGSGSGYVTVNNFSMNNVEMRVFLSALTVSGMELTISNQKIINDNPSTTDDWYKGMLYNDGNLFYVQGEVAGGGASTLYSGGWLTDEGIVKIRIENGLIRLYEQDTERHNEAFALTSRDCYIYIYGRSGAGFTGTDWADTFWIRKYVDPEPIFDNLGTEEGELLEGYVATAPNGTVITPDPFEDVDDCIDFVEAWDDNYGPVLVISIANIDAVEWVFEGKKRYEFTVIYINVNLTDIDQVGVGFTDEINHFHSVWYDRDANTLTVTSPEDGISGWLHSISQTDINVTAVFHIMFNIPIPDSYDVSAYARIVDTADSGWVTPRWGEDGLSGSLYLFNIYNLGGLSTLTKSGTAGRVTGGDIFEIYAADTRTRNIVPVQDFDVRAVPLPEGWIWGGITLQEAGDEQTLLEEVQGWKWWLSTRTENQTIHPTNRKPTGAGTNDKTYVSWPFGLKIKANPITSNGLMAEKEFWRKITPSDNEIVTIQVQAMTPQTTGTTGKILITNDGYIDDLHARAALDSKQAVDLVFVGNGSMRLTDGAAGYIYPATYTGMIWYNFTFVINCTAQSYDFYVDEVLNATDVDFRQKVAGANSVGHITFMDISMAGNFTEFYVDDIRAYTDFDADYGGYAESTMLFKNLQHWSMDFDFFVENGIVYAQGASGTPQRVDDDYSDYGYIELGWDIMINETYVNDFLVARLNITDGHISGKNDWIKFNVTWYKQGVYIKNDLLYGLFEGYSIYPGGEKDTAGFHWDIWFNRANASTIIGARINTEFYGMSDKSVWWAVWSSNWKPMRTEVSESTVFIDLEDANGTIHSAKNVLFVRSRVKVLRNTLAQFSYKVLNIAGLDFLIARDTMSGIDTPPIRETVVPDIISGFFGSALGSIFSAALKRLGNTLAGFGMGFFTLSIDFIDNVFAALGYPALVATIFGWMDSLFSYVPTLLGYGITLIGNVFTLINVSASNTLIQLASVVTIWAGMYGTMMDMLSGVMTPGINLWNDLGVNSFIQIGAILYPLWLLMMGKDKGMQAVIDHLNGVLNIGSFFLNFILNVGGFFMGLLTGLIGAIRG